MTHKIESVLLIEPEEIYHSRAGELLSSHLLGSFRECHKVYHDIVTKIRKPPDTSVFTFGRAFHVLVLEGIEEFHKRFTWEAPVNSKTGKPFGSTSQKYQDWVQECKQYGQQALSISDVDTIIKMATSVEKHTKASATLKSAPYRERVIRLTYCGHECQIRMDAAGKIVGIVDLKSCRSLPSFPYDAEKYGYFNQLAFYREVLRLSNIGFNSRVDIIATEKAYPFRTGIWNVSPVSLDSAQEENEVYMKKLKVCQERNVWPTGYEAIRILTQR